MQAKLLELSNDPCTSGPVVSVLMVTPTTASRRGSWWRTLEVLLEAMASCQVGPSALLPEV